jgi:hypothetical protein
MCTLFYGTAGWADSKSGSSLSAPYGYVKAPRRRQRGEAARERRRLRARYRRTFKKAEGRPSFKAWAARLRGAAA